MGNTANNNSYVGIRLVSDCNSNFIMENIIRFNDQYGVFVDSLCDKNIIYLNEFIGNGMNALDDGINTFWDDGIIGNY